MFKSIRIVINSMIKKILIILFVLFFVSVNADAKIIYTVKQNDTLNKISKRFNVKSINIKKANHLKNNKIYTGHKLIIPNKKHNYSIANKKSPKPKNIFQNPDLSKPIKEIQIDNNITELSNIDVTENREQKYSLREVEPDILNISTRDIREDIILFAKKMLNLPYKLGANSINAIDCSGYVQKVFEFVGINIPRSAREQFNNGVVVEKDDLLAGDLVFFRTYAKFPSHVGIYLGENLFIHASSKAKKVKINSLDTPYYFKHYVGAKRLFLE